MTHRPNELKPQFLHIAGLNPFQREDSSARVNMFSSSHAPQALVIEGANPRLIQTGIERKFARTTFNIKMPVNGTIAKIIHKYPEGVGYGASKINPMSYVFYRDDKGPSPQLGVLEIPKHHCLHQHFGFKYKPTAAAAKLYETSSISKGTILADSPAVDANGDYAYGVDAKVALMSIPGIIEDGVVVSESFTKKLRTRGFETVTESYGKEWYPLNIYGGPDEYKGFPDIGDVVRDDGLLMVLRRYDDMLGPVEMTPDALRVPDYMFDRPIYTVPGAKVIDITIKHDNRLNPPPTPVGMEVQAAKYYKMHQHMQREIIRFYRDQMRANPKMTITPDLSALISQCLIDTNTESSDRSLRMYRRIPLDDWRVEITLEYPIDPTVTFKVTGCHGDKGVIVQVWPDEDMPRDAYGNVADMIMDGKSTAKRMNLGRLSEQYLNATSADVVTRSVRELFQSDMGSPAPDMGVTDLVGKTSHLISSHVTRIMAGADPTKINQAWEYLLRYYKAVSPQMHALLTSPSYKGTPASHVESVLREGVYIYYPSDNELDVPTITSNLMAEFPLAIGPVTYRGRSGRVVTTKMPILIGSMYILLLEKTGGDWSGVSSARTQVHGFPARLTNRDKHSAPGRQHPVRFLGEDEVRLSSATVGAIYVAEVLEMSNNPALHRYVTRRYLESETPTNIDDIVDRAVIPPGGSRPLVFTNHMLEMAGMAFEYADPAYMDPTVYVDTSDLVGDEIMDDEDEEGEEAETKPSSDSEQSE